MQGCNGSNYAKWGFANNGKAEEWVSQYGWTYTGTQDGYRYFTFGNDMFLMPQGSTYYVEVSDGYWDACSNWVNPCNFDAWQDYLAQTASPSAQMRIWVDGYNRPQNQADRYLESPKIGQTNCVGSASGSTSTTISASAGVSGGGVNATIGASDTQNQNFYTDGMCNANSDAYSTYININWDGASQGNNYRPTMTTSAINYVAISSTNGPDGLFSNRFSMDMNMMENWWNSNSSTTDSVDLFNNLDKNFNTSYSADDWVY